MVASPVRLSFVRQHPVAVFFALAYLISWSLSLFAARGLLPFPVPLFIEGLAGVLYRFGPALAGIIVAARLAGRAGLRELLGSLGRWRVPWYWFALIALYPVALRLAAVAIAVAFGSPPPPFFNPAAPGLLAGNPVVIGIGVFASTLVLTGLAEEIGWRGFALPVLQRSYSALSASLLLAALSALWHYHPLNIPVIRPYMPWHVVSVFAMTILLTFVYNSTQGNLLMVVLFHAFSNFSDWLVPTNPKMGGTIEMMTAQVLLNIIVAVIVVLVFGANRLAVRRAAPHTWPDRLL